MRYLLVPVLCLGLLGCKVDLALQEEIATLTKAVATSVLQLTEAEGRIAKVYADFKAGTLTKEQLEVEWGKIRMDIEVLKAQKSAAETSLANANTRAKEQNMNGWDLAYNALISIAGVMVGRRLGVPGLASKATKPSG